MIKIKVSILALIIVIFLSSVPAYSQGEYLEKGQTGYGLRLGLGLHKNSHSISGQFGCSLSSYVDLGIGLTRIFDRENDKSQTVVSPSITAHPIKDVPPIPIAVSVAFEYGTLVSRESGEPSIETNAFGVFFHKTIVADKGVSFMPTIGLVQAKSEIEYEGHYSFKNTDKYAQFGMDLITENSSGKMVVFGVNMANIEGERVFNLSISLVG